MILGIGAAILIKSGIDLVPVKKPVETKIEQIKEEKQTTEVDKVFIDPQSPTFRQDVEKIMPHLYAHMISTEGYYSKIYKDGGGTLTVGAGFALHFSDNRKQFTKITNGKKITIGTKITNDEGYKLFEWYLNNRVLTKIKNEISVPMDYRIFVGLVLAMYNRGPSVINKGNDGETLKNTINLNGTLNNARDNILQAYLALMKRENKKGFSGLRNKYRILADYMDYLITDDQMFSSVAGAKYKALSDARVIYGGELGTLPIDREPIPEIAGYLLRVNPYMSKGELQKPVYEYIPKEWIQALKVGKIYDNSVILHQDL